MKMTNKRGDPIKGNEPRRESKGGGSYKNGVEKKY